MMRKGFLSCDFGRFKGFTASLYCIVDGPVDADLHIIYCLLSVYAYCVFVYFLRTHSTHDIYYPFFLCGVVQDLSVDIVVRVRIRLCLRGYFNDNESGKRLIIQSWKGWECEEI